MVAKPTYTADQLSGFLKKHGSATAAAKASGISRSTFDRYVRSRRVEAEDLPPSDIPIEELLKQVERECKIKNTRNSAERIRKHKLNIKGPFAVMWFGDPHLDDPHCMWDKVHQAFDIADRNPEILCANIGDSLNNWIGRLQSIYAHQPVTISRAMRLYEWFLNKTDWWLWLFGNHCMWDT